MDVAVIERVVQIEWSVPAGWERVQCVGGAHDQAAFWSLRPPRAFRVVPDGDVYHQRAEGVWVAEGRAWTPAPPSDEQMSLA